MPPLLSLVQRNVFAINASSAFPAIVHKWARLASPLHSIRTSVPSAPLWQKTFKPFVPFVSLWSSCTQLRLINLAVNRSIGQQLVMRAAFGDAPLVQHEDLVCAQDAGDALRNDERRAGGRQLC